MKILIVSHDSRPYGACASLLEWSLNLKSNELFFIFPKRKCDELSNIFKEKNIRYKSVRMINCVNKGKTVKTLIKKILWILQTRIYIPFLARKIKKEKFDYVLSNTASIDFGAVLAEKLGIKHIWHIREFLALDHRLYLNNSKRFRYYAKKSYAIFISNCLKEYWLNNFEFKKHVVIYNEISLRNVLPRIYENKSINILMAGRIQKNKGQEQAIQAIEIINQKYNIPIKLFVYGEGPDEIKLKKYVTDNNISNVYFGGFTKNLNEVRQKMDICLICSHAEAFGRVTIESMYSRNFVIASNCGANLELIKNGENGLLYEYGNSESLAMAIMRYYNMNIVDRNKILDYAYEYSIANFSKDISDKIIDFISS